MVLIAVAWLMYLLFRSTIPRMFMLQTKLDAVWEEIGFDAAASAGAAFWNALLPTTVVLVGGVWPALRPILIIFTGVHSGCEPLTDAAPQLREKTRIRLFGRSQT